MNKKLHKIFIISLVCLLLVCVSLIVLGCDDIGLSKKPTATIYFYMQDERVSYQIVTLNQVLKAPEVSIPSGYQIDGWYFDKNEWTSEYTKANLATLIENGEKQANVYAKLSLVDYEISYTNVKGADISSFATQYTIESDTITLPNISADYYTFDGWYDGNTRVTEIAAGSFGNKTLSAKFTPIDYTITYSGTKDAANGNPSIYNFDSGEIALLSIAKDGYKFEGWYQAETEVTSIPANSHGDVELTAQWSLVDYSITYEQTKTADTSEFPNVFTVESETITLPEISAEYYVFDGWYVGSAKVTEIATGSFGNKVLTAKFTPIDYTITYNGTKGAINGNPASYNIDSNEITLAPIAKDGYNFEGWYQEESEVTSIPANSHGNIEFTAQWSLVTYSITYAQTFDFDTSTFPDSYTIESDNIALPESVTAICRIFTGWTLNGNTVTNISTGTYGNLVLTATYDLDHDVIDDVYVAPTCEATGKTAGSHCDRCSEILVAQNTIPALGHDYASSWEWDEYNSATVSLVCKNDGTHAHTVNAAITTTTVQPTCAEKGMNTYTARASYDGTAYSDVKTQVIETVPHNYVAIANNKEKHTCSMCNQLFDHVDTNYCGTCEVCAQFIEEIIEIKSNYNLADIKHNLSASYVLRDDITLEGTWASIGSTSQPFTGKLYGNGFAIYNLNVHPSATDGGLFVCNKGLIDGVTLKHLTVWLDSSSSAPTNMTAGGFAAFNYGTIRNCTVEGTTAFYAHNQWQNVDKTHVFTGGAICGINYKDGKIENCEVSGTVTGSLRVKALTYPGGFGYATKRSVTSTIYYGNIAGINEGSVSNCISSADFAVDYTLEARSQYATCEAHATMNSNLGSLVGENRATISNCKAKPYIEGSRSIVATADQFASNSENTAKLNITNAPTYEGIVAINTESGKIIGFEKLQ